MNAQAMFNSTTIPMLEQVVDFAQSRHNVLAGNLKRPCCQIVRPHMPVLTHMRGEPPGSRFADGRHVEDVGCRYIGRSVARICRFNLKLTSTSRHASLW